MRYPTDESPTVSHSLRYEVNCSILFTELPLLERPAAAADAGFTAVEFWWPFSESVPADRDVDEFVSAVRDAGVALVGLNFAAGDMPGGDRGLVSWPARSIEFRESVEVLVSIGEQLGCAAFNALYGNRVPDLLPVEQHEMALTNLAFAANAASRIGGTVLVEPISGAPGYPLRTAADALAVIDQVEADAGVTNIALLADLYHLAVNGDDVDRVIADHADRIGHVQIADDPGRHEPGSGELPLERQLAALEAAGYVGWVGLEYTPATTTVDSFSWVPRARRSGAAAEGLH